MDDIESEIGDNDNVLNVMVATDIHLGYNEKDPIRGQDSFIAFEEILRQAKYLEVDFILLGGDLFHDVRPSTSCLHKCMTLLRKYCMGDREVQIEFLSDQSLNFKHQENPHVNYEDPNQNISIPVFSIHGNHDDPTGPSRLSALDLLADVGLVNYFGKWSDLTEIIIYPLLIQKGNTKLALYGLSHIRDERLSRLFANGQVKMPRPKGEYFNLMVLHQNRVDRGPKNFIPEDVLPNFLDLVIWGHEHDCLTEEYATKSGIHIVQPGSSVATSLALGESLPKHCALLKIKEDKFKVDYILLKTVRPFVFDNQSYNGDCSELHIQNLVENEVRQMLDNMLVKAKSQIHDDEPQQPKLPLIRLVYNILHENQQFNTIKIGQEYSDQVANPEDIVMLKLRKKTVKRERNGYFDDDEEEDEKFVEEGQLFCDQVESLLEQYMETQKRRPMQILSMKAMCQATVRFMEQNDESAFEHVTNHQNSKTKSKLLEMDIDLSKKTIDAELDILLNEFRMERLNTHDEKNEIIQMLNDPKRKFIEVQYNDELRIENVNDSDDDASDSSPSKSKGKGRGAGRGRGRGLGRKAPAK